MHHRSRYILTKAASEPRPKLTHSTRAGSGIGLETSLLFASEGAHVICADINLQTAERTVHLIAENFPDAPKAIAIKCDVGKEDEIKGLVKKSVEWGGRLDVMFNKCVEDHEDFLLLARS